MEGKKLLIGIIIIVCCIGAVKADNVVISEIQYNAPGADERGKEWFELYNPTSSPIDISGYMIYKESFSYYGVPLLLQTFPDGTVLAPYSYFLIGSTGPLPEDLPTPDLITGLHRMDNFGDGLSLRNPSGTIIDAVGWGGVSIQGFFEGDPIPHNASWDGIQGFSVERRMGQGCGNAIDTNNNTADFFYQPTPNPQNSASPPQPPCDISCQSDSDCAYLNGVCSIGSCNDQETCVKIPANEGAPCDDGYFCTEQDVCLSGTCRGTPLDCTANDLQEIHTCTYSPDNNPFTLDYAPRFISECNEKTMSCTTGSQPLTHSCSMITCGAGCETDIDCQATDCDSLDGCVGPHYYDYQNVENICLDSCSCTENPCLSPKITNFDPRCTKVCETDADCDDGIYCNGQEKCNAASGFCVSGTPIDCSENNLPGISTCVADPDGNPFTFDSQQLFKSVCDEDTRSCTSDEPNLVHTCDIQRCNAECETHEDCGNISCETLSGCYGNDWREYNDAANSCEGCICSEGSCTDYDTSIDDPRCDNSCSVDSDCSFLDSIACSGYMITQTTGECIDLYCESVATMIGYCDEDGDGVADINDTVLGNSADIGGTQGFVFKVNGVADPGSPEGLGNVTIENNGTVIVEFPYNFTNQTRIILSEVHIQIAKDNDPGYVIVSGIDLPEGMTKTIYLTNKNGIDSLCIKDSPNASMEEISLLCTGSDEQSLICPGTIGQYECGYTDLNNSTFWLSGLKHSAVKQQTFCGDGDCNSNEDCTSCAADCGECPAPAPIRISRGGGGGGGGFIIAQTDDGTAQEEDESLPLEYVGSEESVPNDGSGDNPSTGSAPSALDSSDSEEIQEPQQIVTTGSEPARETDQADTSEEGMAQVTGNVISNLKETMSGNWIYLAILVAVIIIALWYGGKKDDPEENDVPTVNGSTATPTKKTSKGSTASQTRSRKRE